MVPTRCRVSLSIHMGVCGSTNGSFPWKPPSLAWSPDAAACGSCMLTPSR